MIRRYVTLYAKYATPVVVLLGYILNYFLGDAMFKWGLNSTIRRQMKYHDFATSFQNLALYLCDPNFVLGLLIVLYVLSRRKISILVFVFFVLMNFYLNCISRNILQQARPFWVTLDIFSLDWQCRWEYGSPSINGRNIFVVYEPLLFDLISTKAVNVTPLLVPVILALAVPVICLNLGNFSLDQVMLGTLIGLCYLCFYRYFLQQKIYLLYFGLFKNKQTRTLLLIFLVNIVLLLLPIAIYKIQLQTRSIDHNWKQIIELACQIPASRIGAPINLTGCIFLHFIFGTLVACWLDERFTQDYLMGQWVYVSQVRRTMVSLSKMTRIVMQLLLVAFFVLVVILSKYLDQQVYYLVGCLSMWLLGFSLATVVPKTLSCLDFTVNVVNQGDIFIRQYYDC